MSLLFNALTCACACAYYCRRDPRFDFGRRVPRFCWTPPRVNLELISVEDTKLSTNKQLSLSLSPAYPTVTGHTSGDVLYSSAHARIQMQMPWTCVYLASQSTVTGPVNTARIIYHGYTLRTA